MHRENGSEEQKRDGERTSEHFCFDESRSGDFIGVEDSEMRPGFAENYVRCHAL